jgi:M6 family metalloprotease-like protein
MRALRTNQVSFLIVSALLVGVPGFGAAQANRVEQVRTADGLLLDFPRDGVWRVKARRVAERRAMLLSQGRFAELNAAPRAPTADITPPNVSGTLYMPTILLAFKDSDTTTFFKATKYDSVLYGTGMSILPGRPYSLRTFYEEMSNGVFSVQGRQATPTSGTFGWAMADSNKVYYLDPPDCPSDELSCAQGRTRARELFTQAISRVDGAVDFGLFDNDGPDGIPNSGDDDGKVDVIQFVQPVRGRECNTGEGYNAHRFFLSALGGAYTTNDARTGGGSITIDSYYLVSGIGGTFCTDETTVMAIGTSAHELGHGVGLPDLYDTELVVEGAGEWSLMGSGNYRSLQSPAHFDAWSKQQMGWVTIRPLTTSGTYNVGPVVTSDTVFLIRPGGSNPRGEYFLLENKQAVGSDTANMLSGSRPKGGGLAIWHIDSTKIAQSSLTNTVNSGTIHGVALIQADNLNQLRTQGGNRGDNGDPYPGSTVNRRLSYNSAPANTKNSDGTFVAFEVDSITQVTANGPMVFKLLFGGPTIVRATDTTAQVSVDGVKYRRFAQLLEAGSTHTIGIDSVQLTTDSLTQFYFDSWSDAGARTHQITISVAGDSVSANVHERKRVRVTKGGQGTGTVTATPPSGSLTTSGVYVRKDSALTLTATPDPGNAFAGWSGDTTTSANPLALTVSKPYTLVATFAAPVVADAGTPPEGVVNKSYTHTLTATGGTGTYTWSQVGGNLPPGLSLSEAGSISGTPSQAGNFSADVRATSGPMTDDVTVAISVYVQLAAIIGAPPEPRVGQAYSHDLMASGGTGAYSWSVVSGALPTGLSLSTAGSITGTPTTQGTFNSTVRVTSGSQTADANLSLTAATTLTASAGTPPAGVMGKAYGHQVTASGGTGTYSWAVQSGSLPDGLALAASGAISGIPAKTGSFNATARVTSGSQTQDVNVAISVTAPVLQLSAVVAQILGTNTSALNADELKYLDLLGNNNGSFDVGDFLAWVDATGATPAALAEAMAALAEAGLLGPEVRR